MNEFFLDMKNYVTLSDIEVKMANTAPTPIVTMDSNSNCHEENAMDAFRLHTTDSTTRDGKTRSLFARKNSTASNSINSN